MHPITINALLIMKERNAIFFMLSKHIRGCLRGVLRSSWLFQSRNCTSLGSGQFSNWKSLELLITPLKRPHYMFAQIIKINITNVIISSELVILCPCGLHTHIKSTKTSQSPQKTHQSDWLCTVLWRPYSKIYERK